MTVNNVRARFTLLAAVAAISIVGCGPDPDELTEPIAPLCGPRYTYEGQTYKTGPEVRLEVAEELKGDVRQDNCPDDPGRSKAFRVVGLPTDVAVAIGPTEADSHLYISAEALEEPSGELDRYLEQRIIEGE